MKSLARTVIVVTVFTLGLLSAAYADTITYVIEDLADFATYRSTDLGLTFEGTGFVGMQETNFTHIFALVPASQYRTLLEVDISGLAGADIQSAYLTFDLVENSGDSQTVNVTSFDAAGVLGHYWNLPAEDVLGTTSYTVQGLSSNSLDVTDLLLERVDAGSDWLGLQLAGTNRWTYTRTAVTDGWLDRAQVRLVVEYTPAVTGYDFGPERYPDGQEPVPEPSTFVLLGMGLVGAAARLRKHVIV